MTSKCFL